MGPSADAIELMGNKSRARQAATAAGVPTLPAATAPSTPDVDLLGIAETVGYPLVVKASAGGGGRGIRLVTAARLISSQPSSRPG